MSDKDSAQAFHEFFIKWKAENDAKEAAARAAPAAVPRQVVREMSQSDIKEFFAGKKRELQTITPEQETKLRSDYLKRREELAFRVRFQNAVELKAQPGFKATPDEALLRIAAMRVEFKKELDRLSMKPSKAQESLKAFDAFYSKPENLKEFLHQVGEHDGSKEKAAVKEAQDHLHEK